MAKVRSHRKSRSKSMFLQKIDPKNDSRKGGDVMPVMSKKVREEMAYFINDKGRIQYNEQCVRCIYDCKQSYRAILVCCPRYRSKRSEKND